MRNWDQKRVISSYLIRNRPNYYAIMSSIDHFSNKDNQIIDQVAVMHSKKRKASPKKHVAKHNSTSDNEDIEIVSKKIKKIK